MLLPFNWPVCRGFSPLLLPAPAFFRGCGQNSAAKRRRSSLDGTTARTLFTVPPRPSLRYLVTGSIPLPAARHCCCDFHFDKRAACSAPTPSLLVLAHLLRELWARGGGRRLSRRTRGDLAVRTPSWQTTPATTGGWAMCSPR